MILFDKLSQRLPAKFSDVCKFLHNSLDSLPRVCDLLLYLPLYHRRFVFIEKASQEFVDKNIVILLKITNSVVVSGKTARIRCVDSAGQTVSLVFFGGYFIQSLRSLKSGDSRYIRGTMTIFGNIYQIVHPIQICALKKNINQLIPVYQYANEQMAMKIASAVEIILDMIDEFEEWIPEQISKNWPKWKEAIARCHQEEDNIARMRLGFDELLAYQLALKTRRELLLKNRIGIEREYPYELIHQLKLPFELTNAQQQAIKEIIDDLTSGKRMMRLLQGDVGSGKTIVAIISALVVINNNEQVAILAPTELLAIQHYEFVARLLYPLGIRVELLSGGSNNKKSIHNKIASGFCQFIVGTHAMIQNSVTYKNLGLIIVDEQHRFGVGQRSILIKQYPKCDVLYMSATPIPRSLMMIIYGDLDVTLILDKPKNRIPVVTLKREESDIPKIIQSIQKIIDIGGNVFWVCPLVSKSEMIENVISADERYEYLQGIFQDKVGLLHGKMKESQKIDVINQFKTGELKLLVATTIVEVGVDIPSAQVMIIENAERYGMAQLHQLRGRVGRGEEKSYCVLLTGQNITKIAQQRIDTLCNHNDGFFIAEQDLKLRGEGDLLGTKQSGYIKFKIANSEDYQLLQIAYETANNFDYSQKQLDTLSALFGITHSIDQG